MKNDVVEFVWFVLVLVLGASLECVLPKLMGLGFPVLLAAVVPVAARRPLAGAVGFAVTAGLVEDSLSALPLATSVAYFLLLTAAVRSEAGRPAVSVLAYPLYQLWLWIWTAGSGGNVFSRFLLAFPVGFATLAVTAAALAVLERKAALDG